MSVLGRGVAETRVRVRDRHIQHEVEKEGFRLERRWKVVFIRAGRGEGFAVGRERTFCITSLYCPLGFLTGRMGELQGELMGMRSPWVFSLVIMGLSPIR